MKAACMTSSDQGNNQYRTKTFVHITKILTETLSFEVESLALICLFCLLLLSDNVAIAMYTQGSVKLQLTNNDLVLLLRFCYFVFCFLFFVFVFFES